MRDWCSDVGSSDLVEALVDVVERQGVGDEVVDVDLALHVPVDDLGHVGAPARAAEGGALPDPSADELEGTGGNLLASAGPADDDRDTPALLAALPRLAHYIHVAEACEGVGGTGRGAWRGDRGQE